MKRRVRKFTISRDQKREFQFKIFNCIIFTNDKLFLFGVADSPTCPLCQTEVESIEHLLSTFPVKYHPIFGSVSCPETRAASL